MRTQVEAFSWVGGIIKEKRRLGNACFLVAIRQTFELSDIASLAIEEQYSAVAVHRAAGVRQEMVGEVVDGETPPTFCHAADAFEFVNERRPATQAIGIAAASKGVVNGIEAILSLGLGVRC